VNAPPATVLRKSMPAFHQVLLLYNPVAGHNHAARTRELLAAAQVFRDAGVEVELEPTLAKGEGGRQAKAALARGFDAIFACGGDGTVFDVLQGMVHGPEQVALGVLPLGTANVLATDLELPGDIKAAARLTLGYTPRRIAAGQLRWNRTPDQAEERTIYFSVAAGVGVHAELIYDASALLKRHGGFAAYYIAGLSLLMAHDFTPFSAEITLPDGSRRREELFELVGMRVRSFGKWLPLVSGRSARPGLPATDHVEAEPPPGDVSLRDFGDLPGRGTGIEKRFSPGRIRPCPVCPLPRDRHQFDSSPAGAGRWRGDEGPAGRNVHRAARTDAADAKLI
jgi:diacylglycerol kinase family enzyme